MTTESTPVIVCLDDSPAFAKRLAQLLESFGWRVVTVSEWPDLLRTLRGIKPDLLLLDLNMPILPGEVVGKTVRRFYPDLPILFLTGEAAPRATSACAEIQGSHYVCKDQNMQRELPMAVKRALAAQRLDELKRSATAPELR